MKLRVDSWFERDRACVALVNDDNDKNILEYWDEEVAAAIEDGFLDPKDFYGSLVEYAISVGLLSQDEIDEIDEIDEEDEENE